MNASIQSPAPVLPVAKTAVGVETVSISMRFGGFTALDQVSIRIRPGSLHALLGENGAGKSTLVKCLMGFYRASAGQIIVDEHEVAIPDPKAAHALGLGMVYQHFTLVPSLTAAENLLISRPDAPSVIDWRRERQALAAFMQTMPFTVPLDVPVQRLAAGEKQKLEILKQLYLGSRFLILDEPTSVLTPAEADEVLGLMQSLCHAGQLTVLMISHKLREVSAFADTVSVLRHGRYSGGGKVADLSHEDMAAMMVGTRRPSAPTQRAQVARPADATPVLALEQVRARDRSGLKSIQIDALNVYAGEIVGIAGVSGNGQTELMEILAGQRPYRTGTLRVNGVPYRARRAQARANGVRYLPEEPLRNACAPQMTVAENMAFRNFDVDAQGQLQAFVQRPAMQRQAAHFVQSFNIKTSSLDSPIAALSGGNVQRAVLARELSGQVRLLLIANPCFGLDFAAVAEIRARIMAARNDGTAVLLLSEDLDEILELADRVLVMSEGRISYETPIAAADVAVIGRHMAGHA